MFLPRLAGKGLLSDIGVPGTGAAPLRSSRLLTDLPGQADVALLFRFVRLIFGGAGGAGPPYGGSRRACSLLVRASGGSLKTLAWVGLAEFGFVRRYPPTRARRGRIRPNLQATLPSDFGPVFPPPFFDLHGDPPAVPPPPPPHAHKPLAPKLEAGPSSGGNPLLLQAP